MSGRKPMSSMRSASSRTTIFRFVQLAACRGPGGPAPGPACRRRSRPRAPAFRFAQRIGLPPYRATQMHLAAVRQLEHFLANLHGQFARRHQDQRLRIPRFLVRRRTVPGSEWRTRPFCRCRCGPGPARRCRPGRGGSNRLEWASAEVLGLGQRSEHDFGKAKVREIGVRRGFWGSGVNERFRHKRTGGFWDTLREGERNGD